ncbi:MAG: hypothetical protein V4793_25565 [Paraburkholderia tropica]
MVSYLIPQVLTAGFSAPENPHLCFAAHLRVRRATPSSELRSRALIHFDTTPETC